MAEYGLVDKASTLLDISPAGAIANHLSPTAFFLLVSMLTTCAQGAHGLAHTLLAAQVHTPLQALLAHSSIALANNCTTSAIKSQSQLLQVSTRLAPF